MQILKAFLKSKLVWFLIVLAGALYGGVSYAEQYLSRNFIRLVPPAVTSAVDIGRIGFDLWRGRLYVNDISWEDDKNLVEVSVEGVTAYLGLWDYLSEDKINIKSIHLYSPELKIPDIRGIAVVSELRSKNLERALNELAGSGSTRDFLVGKLEVHEGRFHSVDPGMKGFKHNLENINVSLKSIRRSGNRVRLGDVKGRAWLANGRRSAIEFEYSGGEDAELNYRILDPVDLRYYNPYVKKESLYYFKNGWLQGSGSIDFTRTDIHYKQKLVISALKIEKVATSALSLLEGFIAAPVIDSIKSPDGNVYIAIDKTLSAGAARDDLRKIILANINAFEDKFSF